MRPTDCSKPRRIQAARRASVDRRSAGERGSIAVELVIIAPVLVAVVLLLIAGGRLVLAGNAVESAASAAAREASLARSSSLGEAQATEAAELYLEQSGYSCDSLTVTVDADALDSVLGETGSVTVSISCVVALGDIALPGLGGSRTLTAEASSPVDPYRERG